MPVGACPQRRLLHTAPRAHLGLLANGGVGEHVLDGQLHGEDRVEVGAKAAGRQRVATHVEERVVDAVCVARGRWCQRRVTPGFCLCWPSATHIAPHPPSPAPGPTAPRCASPPWTWAPPSWTWSPPAASAGRISARRGSVRGGSRMVRRAEGRARTPISLASATDGRPRRFSFPLACCVWGRAGVSSSEGCVHGRASGRTHEDGERLELDKVGGHGVEGQSRLEQRLHVAH